MLMHHSPAPSALTWIPAPTRPLRWAWSALLGGGGSQCTPPGAELSETLGALAPDRRCACLQNESKHTKSRSRIRQTCNTKVHVAQHGPGKGVCALSSSKESEPCSLRRPLTVRRSDALMSATSTCETARARTSRAGILHTCRFIDCTVHSIPTGYMSAASHSAVAKAQGEYAKPNKG